MPLRLADLNKEYEIMRIGGSAEVKQHLADLGFHVGAKVIVVSRSGEGMIVSIKGSRIAVGKDMIPQCGMTPVSIGVGQQTPATRLTSET